MKLIDYQVLNEFVGSLGAPTKSDVFGYVVIFVFQAFTFSQIELHLHKDHFKIVFTYANQRETYIVTDNAIWLSYNLEPFKSLKTDVGKLIKDLCKRHLV